MAIYHLTVNIVSRARGQSAVAAAAYRAGAVLRDQRYGATHNYVGKRSVAHTEIMAPANAPAWASDREVLWNKVEAAELRKDAQLARVVEVGLPIELTQTEQAALLRDYVAQQFVAEGMIADVCIRGHAHNPHAHILLTLRTITAAGFGAKERRWNGKAVLHQWRSAWAECANEHLARAGHAVRIDHRTLDAQQIELMPGRRIGVARTRRDGAPLPQHVAERIAEQERIARENGAIILADPSVALRALTHQRPSFTREELAHFLRSRTADALQFDAALAAISQCADLVALAVKDDGRQRFTSRDMLDAERSLLRRSTSMAARRGHAVAPERRDTVAALFAFDDSRRFAFDYLVGAGDAKALAVAADDKGCLLAAANRAWTESGMMVMGAAPSSPAAASLQSAAGIRSYTLAEHEERWRNGIELDRDAVLLLDGAQSIGLKQLERVLAAADRVRAKAVFIADDRQLAAMKIEPPFSEVLRACAG